MTPIFLDFEASGLSPQSWPIEIGLAWIDGDSVTSVASLIRPHPSWRPASWSQESARIHRIRRAELEAAPEAVAVAARFCAMMVGRPVVSDAPEWDQHWLGRLRALLPESPPLRLLDFDALAHLAFEHPARSAAYQRLAAVATPHRAGKDAERLATAWLAGLRAARTAR